LTKWLSGPGGVFRNNERTSLIEVRFYGGALLACTETSYVAVTRGTKYSDGKLRIEVGYAVCCDADDV